MSRFIIDADITKSDTLPTSFYTDQSLFEEARRRIFESSWQFIGDINIVEDHTYYPFKLLEGFLPEPLLLTKASDHIKCLSNVCTHRGNLLKQNPGNDPSIVCGYHGRKFSLDGKMEFMPEFQDVQGFPAECDHLTQVPLSAWHQFLFTSFDKKVDFASICLALEERVGFLPIADLILDQSKSKDYHVKGHWALYCDNYLEGFHIPFVHKGLNDTISYPDYETILYKHCNVQIGQSKNDTDHFDLPEGHVDYGKKIAAYYFWIFPNMMFNFYPWGLSINIVKPVSANETKVSFLSYVWDESKIEQSAGAALDRVEIEDEEVVESVQEGIYSRFYQKGRFSPTMERGVHHFHRLIAEFME